MCGFVGDIIGGVVDVIGSVAEFVVDNALPIISTVALNYFAPGIGTYFSISETAVKAIGSAAISALNGGSIADIATAGLTPFLPSIGQSLGINLDPTGFINSSIADVLGDNVVSSIISNAVGSATMAGVTAAVTGGDILKAAGMAGLSNVVGSALSQTWNTLRENAPTLKSIEDAFSSLVPEVQKNAPIYKVLDIEYNECVVSKSAYDTSIGNFELAKSSYDYTLDLYNQAKGANNVELANSYAEKINNELYKNVENAYADYQYKEKNYVDAVTTYNNNTQYYSKQLAVLDQAVNYQSYYDVLTNQIQADYAQFQMTDAITKGDYTAAAEFNKQFNNYNESIAKVAPEATVGSYLNPTQSSLLSDLSNTTDTALKEQLISRIKLDPSFADIKVPDASTTNFKPYKPENLPTDPINNDPMQKYGNAQVKLAQAIDNKDYASAANYNAELKALETEIKASNPNAVIPKSILSNVDEADILEKIATATDPTLKQQFIDQAKRLPSFSGVAYDTESAYQQALNAVPETGIGQPTPPTPSTGTGTGTTTGGTASNIGNYLTNVGSNLLGNVTKGVVTNEILNAILGNDPQRPSLPTKPRPPSKVDVSTLRPFSGNLPSNVTASVTPEKKDPTTLTPLTGGLPTTGGTTTPTTTPTTPTTNTTTQTPTGGLQSNQTQTPPTKVDVSKLTPVTDTNWLKSLGIA